MVDLGDVPDKTAGIATVAPILLAMIERHDDHTTSNAEAGIRRLWDPLQAKIQDYTSLVETMAQYLAEDWNPPPAAQVFASAAAPGMAPSFVAPPARRGGFPTWIFVPLILVGAGSFAFLPLPRRAP